MAIKVSGTEVISDDKRILNNESLPDIRPSLLLDFANSKTLDPRITFTRGSTATYWDGKTTAKAEENLFKYSQGLDNGYWGDANIAVSADTVSAPDGTTTAETIDEETNTSLHYLFDDLTSVASTTYAFSAYLKQGTGQYAVLSLSSGANSSTYASVRVDLSAGTITTSDDNGSATLSSSSITDVGSGWYRCVVVGDIGSNTDMRVLIALVNDGTTVQARGIQSYTGTGQTIYAWGAQLEQRSSATAYTPTTTSPIVKYQPVLQTAASGEARFDHDPLTGESKGLLIEAARVNLVPNSTDPTATNMTSVRSASTDIAAIAPDGTFSARKHTSDATSNGEHYFTATYTAITSGNTYTASYYIKDSGVGYAYVKLYNAFPDTAIIVDLSDKTVNTLTPATFSAINVTDVGNDWYRISVTQTADTTSSTQSVLFGYTTSSTTGAFLGDGYKGAFIWGMQIEGSVYDQGFFSTSYIPTSGSTVTRAIESAEITDISFVNPTELTVYFESEQCANDSYRRYFAFGDNTNGVMEYSIWSNPTGYMYSYVKVNGVVQASSTNGGQIAEGVAIRGAMSIVEGKVAMSINGAAAVTDTTVNLAGVNLTRLRIGRGEENSSSRFPDKPIKKLAVYPKALSDATLQAMTEE